MATMKPEDTHCARSWFSAKSRLMPGIATFTTVADISEAMVPTMTDIISSHR